MLRLAFYLVLISAVVYTVFWLLDRRAGEAPRPPKTPKPRGPLGPDDDDDFLRGLPKPPRE